jgi:hypothetical protein
MAGVSSTTVSNLINCSEQIPISPEKRAKIMEAMRAPIPSQRRQQQLEEEKRTSGEGGLHLRKPRGGEPFKIYRNP